jgi:two-component system cell cycle sensor histidine kinase/response regulator CckA
MEHCLEASLQEQLEHSRRLETLKQLTEGTCHDFNNLLTVINGYCDLLLMKLDQNDVSYPMVSEIRKAGARSSELSEQLLDMIVERRKNEHMLPNQIIGNSTTTLRKLVSPGVRVTYTLDSSTLPVLVDARDFLQVLFILVTNAVDAMPNGGVLKIETSPQIVLAGQDSEIPEGTYTVLTCTDTGSGMDERTLQQIFEPFFTTRKDNNRTGLGLTIAARIVKASGGRIQVWSEPGRGSSFSLHLPTTRTEIGQSSRYLSPGPLANGAFTENQVLSDKKN